jgi:uncharacterized membrane protein YeiH
MNILYTLDLIGTFVFAISGFLTAAGKKIDLFGAAVIAFVTAVGGGTIRDVLIGAQPVGWMQDLNYVGLIALAGPGSYFFRGVIERLRRTMFLLDAVGIGIFTILGLEKTLGYGLSPVIAVLMGTVSAVFGGVLRDVLSNETPLIFRKEIYATACLAGGCLYLGLERLSANQDLNVFLTVLFIITLRILAVRRHWYLPTVS